MYKIIKRAVALAALLTLTATAQEVSTTPTNTPTLGGGLQEIWDTISVSTNYAIALGGGQSTAGKKELAFAEFVYNMTANVGLVIGYDYLWTSRAQNVPSSANLVKGGLSLNAPIKPLKNFGFNNFTVTPFAFMLVATGNGSASEVMGGGLQTKILSFKGWNLNVGGIFEKRTDCGYWNGNYVAGFLALSKGF